MHSFVLKYFEATVYSSTAFSAPDMFTTPIKDIPDAVEVHCAATIVLFIKYQKLSCI
jgi:hypothetical protein